MQHEPTTSPTRAPFGVPAAPKVLICPYCGETQPNSARCKACGGFFEALSRQATHNAMGPWFLRDGLRPFQPGCSYETLVQLVARGRVTRYSIVRGPTTRQFWTVARHVPGVAHLLGYCHACDASVDPAAHGCSECGEPFGAYLDRNHLGLPDVKPLPGEAPEGAEGAGMVGSAIVSGADLPALRAPALPPWAPPVRTPRGLSSFVEDDELLRERAPAVRQANGARSEPGGDAAISSENRAAAAGRAPDDLLGSPAVRSMQRRLARQDRTIRTLAVLLAASIVSGAAVAVIAIARTRGESVTPAGLDAPARHNTGAESKSGTTLPPAPQSNEVETAASGADGGADQGGASIEPAAHAAPVAAEPLADGLDADYRHALDLLGRADDDARPLDERMTACEESLRILRRIASQPEPARIPADVEAQIVRAAELLERLELKAFFP